MLVIGGCREWPGRSGASGGLDFSLRGLSFHPKPWTLHPYPRGIYRANLIESFSSPDPQAKRLIYPVFRGVKDLLGIRQGALICALSCRYLDNDRLDFDCSARVVTIHRLTSANEMNRTCTVGREGVTQRQVPIRSNVSIYKK